MTKYFITVMCLFFSWNYIWGQAKIQDSIKTYMQAVVVANTDSARLRLTEEIVNYVKAIPFNGYKTEEAIQFLGYKLSPDTEVELFSWNIPLQQGQACYNIFKLKDNRTIVLNYIPKEKDNNPPYLFYDLLPFKVNNKKMYVLFGFYGERNINRKAILIADIYTGNEIDFSYKGFIREGERKEKEVFEYGRSMNMTLKHDKQGKRIIFDHLSPEDEKYEGIYALYGPDGRYNAYILKKEGWVFEENVKIKSLK
ncbi:MAG: hypothetical protein LIO65_06145 [Odoribacter sp.]|nr:hypothetical protein [Odoribacter sp.]